MKLVNETIYNSDDLRALFAFLLGRLGGDKDKRIKVAYSRRGGDVGGWAHYGSAAAHSARKASTAASYARRRHEHLSMCIALPGPSYSPTGKFPTMISFVTHVAQVFEHELAHNRGLHHKDMSIDLLHCKQPVPLGTSDFVLRRAETEALEYSYTCPKGHPKIVSQHRLSSIEMHCAAETGPSSTGIGTVRCGYRMHGPKMRKLKTASAPRVVNLDAAKAARATQAVKREARLRASLARAEAKMNRLKSHVAKLRRKVSYYDRKAAKP